MKNVVSATFMLLLLAGVAKGAFDGLVRNFKVASQNATHVTFSWDMQSGYHGTSNINYFYIYYQIAYPGYSPQGYHTYISFTPSATTQINGVTFLYTTSVTSFSNFAQYIMWLYVNHNISPYALYSEHIYAELGAISAIELEIKLWDGQTCFDFTSTTSADTVGNEVYRALRIYCQCTYEFINVIRIRTGYFDCSPTGYVTYRAYIASTDATKRPSTLVGALNNWLQDTNNNTIIAGGRKYTVKPGACGVTVPYTNSPFCSANTPNPSAQVNTAESSQTAAAQPDNTAVIVASVFAVMFFILCLGLVVYILAIKHPQRKMSKPTTGAVEARTNQYIAPRSTNTAPRSTRTAPANRQPNKQNIELEPYEQIYDEMN